MSQPIQNKTYRNASGFRPGIYKNYDNARYQAIVARVDGDDLYLDRLGTGLKSLDREIYFRPSYFGVPWLEDYTRGSLYEGWLLPPGSMMLDVTETQISVSYSKSDLSLSYYNNWLVDHINRQIADIYKKYPTVCLFYSGGIDSITMLSFIKNLGLLPKTHLVYFRNQAIGTELSAREKETYNRVLEMVDFLGENILGFSDIDITMDDVYKVINRGDYWATSLYTACAIRDKLDFPAFIDGFWGNMSLVHMHPFIDQLLIDRNDYDSYERARTNTDCYSQYLLDYHPPGSRDECIPIAQRHIVPKTYNKINLPGVAPIYTPLNSAAIVENVRRLNCDELSFDDIFNASFAKRIVSGNSHGEYDAFIRHGDQGAANNLRDMCFDTSKLQPEILAIPEHVYHHPEGRQWLEHEVSTSSSTGQISINTLVSIQLQQNLAKYLRD